MPEQSKFCPGCGAQVKLPPVQPLQQVPTTQVVNAFSNSTQPQIKRKPIENNKAQIYGLLITIFLSAYCGLCVGIAGLSDCNFYDKKGKGFSIFNIVFAIVFGIARIVLLVYLLVDLAEGWTIDPDLDGDMVKIILGI